MTDPIVDAVPEADYVEQAVPVDPDDDGDDLALPPEPALEAPEADVFEQSREVPLDDEYPDTEPEY
ncbi:hypothetical protein ACFYTQ_11680 [Nocardia sp. NPDC004068]|uniref:hypothetical protein n=1 Tax=Nocardia sp. NPDC004068 TaxID=3364303 RepID=UPI00368BBBD9